MTKSAKKKPAAKKQSATPASVDGAAEAAAEFLVVARKIPRGEVQQLRTDPARARLNVDRGLAALKPHEAALAKLPTPFDLRKMRSLHRLALGLIHAAAQVNRASPGTTKRLVTRAAELRAVLLASARSLAQSGVVAALEVKRIQAGRGVRDQAQDCVDLAQLFRAHAAAVAGKTPVTAKQVDEAWSVGNQLLAVLKPARTKARASEAVEAATESRDRLWTLLKRWHDAHLRRAGMWIWTDAVDQHVPPLLGGVARKKKAASAKGAAEEGARKPEGAPKSSGAADGSEPEATANAAPGAAGSAPANEGGAAKSNGVAPSEVEGAAP